MQTTRNFLLELRDLGVRLWYDDGSLGYRAPEGVLTAERFSQLKAHKTEILKFLRDEQNASSLMPIERVPRNQPLPLSFAQQRLWFLDQLEPESAFYNMRMLLRLTGQLDVTALEASFRYLIERHESLRTVFGTSTQTNNGEANQLIHPSSWAAQFTLAITPVTDEGEAQRLAQIEATTPFKLNEGPLLRVQLLQIAADGSTSSPTEHLLVLNMHHIISDGWSMGLLVKELTYAYRAYVSGQQPTLSALPIQYADFAIWQRDYLRAGVPGARLETQLAYWRAQLTGAPALLELPTDRPRPSVQSYRGARYAFELSADLNAKLNQLAKTHDATLFMVMLAAFNILLARYSRQDDIVVGSSIANRNRAEIEGLIGFFVNTLVLRTQLDDNPTFTELLVQVRQTTLDAYQHQDLPFEQLVDVLNLERTLSYNPLFQVMLVLQNAEIGEFNLPNLTATLQPADAPFAKFDLTLHLMEKEKEGGLWGVIAYATDLFDEATIARMASHFTVLLEGIVRQPDRAIHQLPMLTETEYHQIAHEWNDTAIDFGTPQTIHALFEEQVKRTPNAVALVFDEGKETGRQGDGEIGRWRDEELITLSPSPPHPLTPSPPHPLTYRELNERANQLAHHLIELGVEANTLVAVVMERSLDMVVGLLAVLKADGAYVPIDPNAPSERIQFILNDTNASLILTQTEWRLQIAIAPDQLLVDIDKLSPKLAKMHTDDTQPRTTAEHLAYIIYTSGSTGRPKGVAMQHKAVTHFLQWVIYNFGMNPSDAMLQAATFTFDASVWQIFSPLLSGATLVLPKPGGEKEGLYVTDLIQKHRITFISMVAPLLTLFVKTGRLSECQTIRHFVSGGEVLPLTTIQSIQSQLTAQINHVYGPTETCVFVTWWPCPANPTYVVMGRPIGGTQAYILDPSNHPVPIGMQGELHIGGKQLAVGYLNRPELTAERFIDHPEFGRLYKTGDLCRWRPAPADAPKGHPPNIEYMGRTDFQVKIRGFRIELGEIEHALLAQEGIREAVVLAREESAGDKRLVAYIVESGKLIVDSEEAEDAPVDSSTLQPFNSSTLRSSLAQQLPDYMIPSAFVILDTMPLTPNGKLDRRALPAPEYTDSQSEFVAPRTETEAALVQAFTDVLRVDAVGIHDNFFRMGGDSILSIQVVSRAAQQGYHVTVKDIFQYPTIAELAGNLDAATNVFRVEASQEIQTGDAPLLPIQRWFLNANQPEMYHFNQSFLLTVKQTIEPASLETAIRTLLHHHDALRFQYGKRQEERQEDNELRWQQAYLAEYMEQGNHVPLTLVDLCGIAPQEQSTEIERICTKTQASLNPLIGDLVRFVYFQMSDGDETPDRLFIVIHHLAVDSVSWRILIEDLTTLLDGGELPLKTSSYRDWGEALQRATADGHFDQDMNHWLAEDQVSNLITLPLDNPGALNTIGNSHHLTCTLSVEQTEHLLRTLPEQHDVTLDAVVLTALAETLAETLAGGSHQTNLRVKFESYGRQELFETINLNRTVGWFTSAYPLTIPRFEGTAVKRIRYTLDQLRRITDGGISFGALQHFHPDETVRAEVAALSKAKVVYNYLGQLDSLDNHRFGMASETTGLAVSRALVRDTLLDNNAMIIDGQLHIHWTVAPQLDLEWVETLLDRFQRHLHGLITEACASSEYVPLPSEQEQDQETDSWFVALQQGSHQDAHPPLFCFYPVTGTISQFRSLIPYLSPQQPLYALQARGIYDELPLFHTLEEVAADTIRAIKKIQPTGPYHLLGWSFGARLGYEIAQQLRQRGEGIEFFAILDEYPDNPEEPRLDMPRDSQLANFVQNLGLSHEVAPQYLRQLCQQMASHYGDAPIQPLCRHLAEDGYTFPFETTMVERIYNVYLNNMRIVQQYQLKPYTGDVVVFTAEGSDSVKGMTRWANLVSGSVEQIAVQGTHLTLLNPENIRYLGTEVEKRLVAGKP